MRGDNLSPFEIHDFRLSARVTKGRETPYHTYKFLVIACNIDNNMDFIHLCGNGLFLLDPMERITLNWNEISNSLCLSHCFG